MKNKIAVRTKEGEFTQRELMELGLNAKRALELGDKPVRFDTLRDFFAYESSRKLDNRIYPHQVEFKCNLVQNATASEKIFRDYLDICGVSHYFQHIYHYNKGKNFFILDFFIELKDRRIAIEIDGGYHDTTEQQDKDQKRDNILEKDGVEVYRLTNKSASNFAEALSVIHHMTLISYDEYILIRNQLNKSLVFDKKKRGRKKSYKLNIEDWDKIPKHQRNFTFTKDWVKNMSHVFLFEKKEDHYRINNKGTYYLYYPTLDQLIVERTGTLKGKGMKYLVSRFNRRVK